jgi:hypothetical protein
MTFFATALNTAKYLVAAAPQAAAVHRRARSPFMHLLLSLGIFGVFFVSIVDSSFVPLPVPGITDIMIIFLKRHVPARIFKSVCEWMENHAILSVALPAILPPPMPLSPFVLAAGALNMSRKKFMITFTVSRAVRHIIAAWLGIHYGRHILRLWNSLSDKYATPVLIVLWVGIALSCAFAFWKLYRTSRSVGVQPSDLASRPNTAT